MKQVHPASLSVEQLVKDCETRRTRGSGPGGQHRNKVETAIVITHKPTEISGQASERRSQNANREVAIERLRINLALQFRLPVSEDRTPSELWLSRIKSQRIVVSTKHFDFASLLAEAMDFVTHLKFDVSTAADRLSVSTSQLIKFLKLENAAFQLLNQQREKMGLHRLK